jgi:hypothetical protein
MWCAQTYLVLELDGGVLTPTTLAEARGAVVLDGTADVEGLTEVVDGLTEVVDGLTEVLEGFTEELEGFTVVAGAEEGFAEVEEGTVPGASATW